MQPKPIDSRHLVDIDAQRRTVDTEGIQHLRSVREHKEHPAETDYNIIHDEAGRRNNEEAARHFIENMKKNRAARADESEQPADEKTPDSAKKIPNGQKGSHLDIEA